MAEFDRPFSFLAGQKSIRFHSLNRDGAAADYGLISTNLDYFLDKSMHQICNWWNKLLPRLLLCVPIAMIFNPAILINVTKKLSKS